MKNNLMFNNMPGGEWVKVPHIQVFLCVRSTAGLLFKNLQKLCEHTRRKKQQNVLMSGG
jgi:hypothetical protein